MVPLPQQFTPPLLFTNSRFHHFKTSPSFQLLHSKTCFCCLFHDGLPPSLQLLHSKPCFCYLFHDCLYGGLQGHFTCLFSSEEEIGNGNIHYISIFSLICPLLTCMVETYCMQVILESVYDTSHWKLLLSFWMHD